MFDGDGAEELYTADRKWTLDEILQDAVYYLARVQLKAHARTLKDFLNDDDLRDIVVINMLNFGETVVNINKRFSDVVKSNEHIPWSEIAGLRNVLAHRYFGIDFEELWGIVEDDLPDLVSKFNGLLKKVREERADEGANSDPEAAKK